MVLVHQDETFVAIIHDELHGGCVPRFAQGTGSVPEEAMAEAVINHSLTQASSLSAAQLLA
ncbi:MAG: hypothetical protein GY772_06900 [bacterium]|nr:hypothetical protein [bacterium]